MVGYWGLGQVDVFEENGDLFYSHFFEKPTKFNLPSGVFEIVGNFVQLDKPIKYSLPKLPKPEKRLRIPPRIDLLIGDNPNKATIFVNRHKVIIDDEIIKAGRVVRTFVLCHEVGHYYFKTEWKCDRFATIQMLKMGFNPSQIQQAIADTLKDFHRLEKTIKNTSKKVVHV